MEGLTTKIQSLSDYGSIISIIISMLAFMISFLTYTNNKRELSILLKKERKKRIAHEAVEILILLNITLKDFSNPLIVTNIDLFTEGVIKKLFSKDEIRLSVKYDEFTINDKVIFPNSLNDSKEFIVKVRGILHSFWREGVNKVESETKGITLLSRRIKWKSSNLAPYGHRGPNIKASIGLITEPSILEINSLIMNEFFFNLARLETRIIDLTRVQYFIEPLDPDFYDRLIENYECILKILYGDFREQHNIELNKDMTPKDIKDALYSTINYDQIIERTTFMSLDLRERANTLKKEITVQYLTN